MYDFCCHPESKNEYGRATLDTERVSLFQLCSLFVSLVRTFWNSSRTSSIVSQFIEPP